MVLAFVMRVEYGEEEEEEDTELESFEDEGLDEWHNVTPPFYEIVHIALTLLGNSESASSPVPFGSSQAFTLDALFESPPRRNERDGVVDESRLRLRTSAAGDAAKVRRRGEGSGIRTEGRHRESARG